MRIKQRLLSGIIAGFYALYSVQMVNAASLPSYENEMVPMEEIDSFSTDEAEEADDLSKSDVEDISIPEESEPEEQLLESQTANPYEENLILNYRGEDEISVSRIEDQIQTYSRQMATGETSYTSPYITSAKNQNPYGTCWAHAAIASAEANMVKKGLADSSVDLSEYQLAYFMYHPANDSMGGLTGDSFTWKTSKTGVEGSYLNVGGNQQLVTYHIASWQGLSDEVSAPYSVVKNDYTAELADDYAYGYDVVHLENAYWISMEDKAQVKQAIKEYGAVASSYYHDASYFNVSDYWYATEDVAEYCPASEHTKTNHAVTIIGWDDNFSKEKFSSTYRPSGNGAWFCKNSWGEGFGQEGYFWISYEDAPLLSGEAYVYDMGKADNYDHNYQYDGAYGSVYYSVCRAEANVYTATSDQTLKAVGFYTADSLYQYTVKIYTDCEDGTPIGTLMSMKEGSQLYAGFHTVVLDTPVILETGDKFSVVIEQSKSDGSLPEIYVDSSSTASWFTAVSSAEDGQSYMSVSGMNWTDISKDDRNCRIKAYADDRDASAPTYDITVSDGSANVSKAEEGTVVTITAGDYPNVTFKGWGSDSEGVTFADKTAKVTTFVMPGHSVELRAKFEAQITFDANGHGTAPASQTVTYGGTATKPTAPSADGYTFGGWYQEAACTNAWSFDTIITENKTLYAKWTVNQYTITWVDGNGNTLKTEKVNYGVTPSYSGATPTKAKTTQYTYTFNNSWTPTVKAVTGNTTYAAQFNSKVNQYTVSYNVNGHGTAPASQTVAYGGKVSRPANPSEVGYVFGGWYQEAACMNAWNFDGNTITGNRTLYAKWTACTHTYGAWVVTKEATTTSTGTRKHTCTVCGKTETEELPKVIVWVSSITLNTSQTSIERGESFSLAAVISPENAVNKNVTWKSANTNIAVVSNAGVVTGKAEGTTTITCTATDGSGKSASCTIKVTDYTQTEAFAARLYEKCLGREPEDAGLEHWDEVLVNKERSGAQVAYGFVFSEEYKNKNTSDEEFVEMLYEVFMNRSSDAGGKAHWLEVLSTGVSREYVFRGFAQSQEYTNICNSYGIVRGNVTLTQARDQNLKLTAYVNRMYTKALSRNGEEGGLNHWCSTIQTGSRTPEQVAEAFINSAEFKNKNLSDEEYVKVLYRTFMGREYDQAGLEHWIGELRKGYSRENILHRFAISKEFKNIQAGFGL